MALLLLCRHASLLNLTLAPGAQVYFKDEAPYFGLKTKTWCFKSIVLLGANVFGFPDMISAHEFRRITYESLSIPLPAEPSPPAHVIILDREHNHARHFVNLDAMKQVMAKYGVTPEYTIIRDDATFEEQVRLMARTGVFVTMHGAGIMNEIFLPPGAAVIEIFPVHLKHVLYERIAHYAGVYHFKVSRATVNALPGYHTRIA